MARWLACVLGLQVAGVGAQESHWWSIPQKAGAVIELASAAVRVEFSVPV